MSDQPRKPSSASREAAEAVGLAKHDADRAATYRLGTGARHYGRCRCKRCRA